MYASRILAIEEHKYAHVEKEVLVVIFWVKKFHQYPLGENSSLSRPTIRSAKGCPSGGAHSIGPNPASLLAAYNY